jgi:hypothetical protein
VQQIARAPHFEEESSFVWCIFAWAVLTTGSAKLWKISPPLRGAAPLLRSFGDRTKVTHSCRKLDIDVHMRDENISQDWQTVSSKINQRKTSAKVVSLPDFRFGPSLPTPPWKARLDVCQIARAIVYDCKR